MAWGWRLPFIASIVLVAVALWLRWNVEETPEFQELKASDGTNKAPVVELFRQYKAKLAIGVCTYLVGNAGFFILTTFMISYVTRVLGLPSTVILTAMTIGAVVQMVVTVLAGRLADRFGAARVGIIGYSIFMPSPSPSSGLWTARIRDGSSWPWCWPSAPRHHARHYRGTYRQALPGTGQVHRHGAVRQSVSRCRRVHARLGHRLPHLLRQRIMGPASLLMVTA